MINKRIYDFSGWVTKNDLKCSDGVIIRKDAFKVNDKTTVPLIWNHGRDNPENVLGSIELENRPEGVYGYGYFNDTPRAAYAKSAVKHKNIVAMSIAANNIRREADNVVHGNIFEVSLVTKGANPGAFIEEVLAHGDADDHTVLVHLPYELDILEHSDNEEETMEENAIIDDELYEEDNNEDMSDEEVVEEIIDSMNPAQRMIVEELYKENMALREGYEEMKHNAFENQGDVMEHGIDSKANLVLETFKNPSVGKLSDAVLQHGIDSIDLLFPTAQNLNPVPLQRYPEGLAAEAVLSGVHKSPFSRIKNRWMQGLGDDELLTRGYVKGDEKQIYNMKKILSRETTPKTIYIKQAIDRDDIIDIKDFNVVSMVKADMEVRFKIDLARFILLGDNRKLTDPDRVDEDKIRPIWSDDDIFTVKKTVAKIEDLQEFFLGISDFYKGSGNPTLFMNKKVMNKLRLMTDKNGKKLFSADGRLPSAQDVANQLEVSKIVYTNFLTENQMIYVDLADYSLGNDVGGDTVNFEHFDIDRNQYKYLLEARLSGALTVPASAVAITIGSYSKPESPEPTRESASAKPLSTLSGRPAPLDPSDVKFDEKKQGYNG